MSDPVDALTQAAFAARARGDHQAAVALLQAALDLRPLAPDLHFELGNARRAMGAIEDAIVAYATVIALDPEHAGAHNNLGVMLGTKGRMDDALVQFEAAVRLKPDFVAAWGNFAKAAGDRGGDTQALGVLERAQAANPDSADLRDQAGALKTRQAELHFSSGLAHHGAGRWSQAVDAFRAALTVHPGHAPAWNNLGVALNALGDIDGAAQAYRKAIEFAPDLGDAHSNLGQILRLRGQLEGAIVELREAVRLAPQAGAAYAALAQGLDEAGRPTEALATVRKALDLDPDYADGYISLGIIFMGQGRTDEAFACFVRALELRPDLAEVHCNLGVYHVTQGAFDDALRHFDRALQIDPDHVEARWNRALAYLVTGRFDLGWDEYLWRFKRASAPKPRYPGPQWDGTQAIDGKTVVMVHEQGLGDNLQFVRYYAHLRGLGARVVIHVPGPIADLVASISDVRVVSEPEDAGPYHFHVPMLSLPRLFKTDVETIPARVPYLHAASDLVRDWQGSLADVPGFKVGIVWRGRSDHRNDRTRSMSAWQFARFLDQPGFSAVSLQTGPRPEELAVLKRLPSFFDVSASLRSFADTAAAIANLDLVISVDTSVAHAAGAVAAPVWTLIGSSPDWRWLLDRDDTPWYPTMRLYRQPGPGDWDPVITRVRADLRRLAGHRATPEPFPS